MRKTPLYGWHIMNGGRMVEFAGFSMPVQYVSIIDEHNAVRNNAGIFDVSHMGEIIVSGRGSREFLESLIPTSMTKLVPGRGMYTIFCSENGGIIDDLFVFLKSEEEYYLVVNAATVEKDYNWLKVNLHDGVTLENVTEVTAKIDVQGPASEVLMKNVYGERISKLSRFSFYIDNFETGTIMISKSGYTGENGYELFVDNDYAVKIWERLIFEGRPLGALPAGLGARDTLRLEACYSLYGHEISEDINPYEAGLGWLINSDKEFTGKDVLRNIRDSGPEYTQYCIELLGNGVLHEGYVILKNGENIGQTTSGIYSPTFRKGLGLARLKSGRVTVGDRVIINVRGKEREGVLVKRPFYEYNGN